MTKFKKLPQRTLELKGDPDEDPDDGGDSDGDAVGYRRVAGGGSRDS